MRILSKIANTDTHVGDHLSQEVGFIDEAALRVPLIEHDLHKFVVVFTFD